MSRLSAELMGLHSAMDFLISALPAIFYLKGLFTFMEYYRHENHMNKHYVQPLPKKTFKCNPHMANGKVNYVLVYRYMDKLFY